ncbi:MAG: ABC transporter permease subunit [Firmicutes bacterium]|nr:ABC transporter permease subunit [Bacillota bacterium]
MAAFLPEKISILFRRSPLTGEKASRAKHPFWVMVRKEVMDHINSWRFMILLGLMLLTTIASLYTAMSSLQRAIAEDTATSFVFLKLFTATDGSLPPFITFVSLLGPLIGIALGFDAINSERSRGTLSRLLAQPIPRDYIINAKFVASLLVITFMMIILGLLMMGMGILTTGIPPTPEEFWRVFFFLLVSIVYIGVWLNLAIMFSIKFKQAATSALSGLAVWLFFSLFFTMIVNIIVESTAPSHVADINELISYQGFVQNLLRISPSQLFSEATTTLLVPTIRTLGPITLEQASFAIAGPLPLGQSLLLVWPQLTCLAAAAFIIFGISYVLFMKQEVRSRS